MYYPSSENKGADLRLCFRLCRLLVFPWGGLYLQRLITMSADRKPIVMVTGNKNKLAEFKQILGHNFPLEVS